MLRAALLTVAGLAAPARADFLDAVRRTFQKDISRFFGAQPKKPSFEKPTAKPPPPAASRH